MPVYNFECGTCGAASRVLADAPPEPGACPPPCGGARARRARGPGSTVKERLDNGLQKRAVERFADAERLYEERRLAADARAGGRAGIGRWQAE